MNSAGQVWLGFTRSGGRFGLRPDHLEGGIAILGHGANDLAPLVAFSCHEAGLRVLLLDMDGGVSDRLSGHIDEYDISYFLYDAMRIEDDPVVHAQLLAGAYASALDLSFEQEASLNAVAQVIANELGVASPASLADLIQSPDAAKGRAVDRLRFRLEALRSLNLTGEKGAVKQLLEKSAILNFAKAGSPEARETAAALLIAKVLASGGERKVRPDVIVLTEANRLFKERPVFRKSQRFLSAFVSAPIAKVLASDEAYALDRDYLDACVARILSSAAWNNSGRGGLVLTPNMFMFQNPSYGASEIFIPRDFEWKKGATTTGAAAVSDPDDDLAKRILEEVSGFEGATRTSLVSFLASEFERDRVEKMFDRLQAEGYVAVSPKDKSGRTMHAVSLTEKGKARLGGRHA